MRSYTHVSLDYFDVYVRRLKTDRDLAGALRHFMALADSGYSVIDVYEFFFLYVKSASCSPLLDEHEKYEIVQCLCFYIHQFSVLNEDAIQLVFFTKRIFDLLHTTRTTSKDG